MCIKKTKFTPKFAVVDNILWFDNISVKMNHINLQQQKVEHFKILFFTCSFKQLASF